MPPGKEWIFRQWVEKLSKGWQAEMACNLSSLFDRMPKG
jgi:hypothetical protein